MASEELKRRKREEYETQLFGIHSRSAYEGTKSIIQEEIESVCEKLRQSIERRYKLDPEELSILKTDAKKLRQTYENRAENHMKELNDIFKKFIAVPHHLLLEVDKSQAIQVSQDEFDEMNRKIEDLWKRAKKATIFNAALRQELEIQQRFKVCEDSINNSSKEIANNTVLPSLENKIQKFAQETEKLYAQSPLLESTNCQKNIYNPTIKNLKELD